MTEREPVGVIGAGWVGLVTAACFAELGHRVYCRDIVPEKVESLRRGEVPIFEPGLEELLARNAERLTFTTEMADVLPASQVLFCCVDTPPTYSGDADLSRVQRVVEEIGGSPEHALVMKSTVPVGTGRAIARDHPGLAYVSNPEFLKEGTAVPDFMHPDRVVVGAAADSSDFAERVATLYEPLGGPIVRTDVASAEMIKLASNAFLATKISFINEIANVSEELGADVTEVARGMGLDDRIGPKFLQAGIGYGGSCLTGDETVLVRRGGQSVALCTLEELFDRVRAEGNLEGIPDPEVLYPDDLEVLSWTPESDEPEFLPVGVATRRRYEGEVMKVRTKMGRSVVCTPDHPFVVADGAGEGVHRKLAEDLTTEDWVPIAQGVPEVTRQTVRLPTCAALPGVLPAEVILRPGSSDFAQLLRSSREEKRLAFGHQRATQRLHGVIASGALRLDEASSLGLKLDDATAGTLQNDTYIPLGAEMTGDFWRVVGLYLAEGHAPVDPRNGHRRLQWCFHPTKEMHLVEEVRDFWERLGVKAAVHHAPTTTIVRVSSRLLASWWVEDLGMGRNSYEQRVPSAAWSQDEDDKRRLLAGAWLGDGSWSYVAGGPSVVLEYGTVSRELADGILRMLGELGFMVGLRVGRTAKSTKDTYWLRLSGADQVERALFLTPPSEHDAIRSSLARQAKRIAPTGYRRHSSNAAWARVASLSPEPYRGYVYSLEVPPAHTFVTTGGLVCSNCFPKDVSALKQLAGNSGYHFQLLTAVIEVNELQKRRTIGKLQKHLGSLVGKHIALLGVAFKPNTDDVREATSLVLAARLQGEGAHVRVYDPVAAERAEGMLGAATIAESALDALDDAHAAVLVTEWPEFGELDWAGEAKARMSTPLVVDGRNFLDGDALRAAGFTYEGVGR